MQQRYVLRSEIGSLYGPQGTPGGAMSWQGSYDSGTTYQANDAVISSDGRGFYALQDTTGNAPPLYPATTSAYWSLFCEKGVDGIDGIDGEKLLWDDMPGSPTRVSDTSFSITDTGNANLYDQRFPAGTIISWDKYLGGWQVAKVVSASYAADAVTFAIVGNTLSAGFTDMTVCACAVREDIWTIPGMMPGAAQSAMGRKFVWLEDRYVFSAKVMYGTGPTTTKGVWDINDDGSTIFSTKPEIAAGSTEGTEVVCNSLLSDATTAIAAKSSITLDYDSGHATTPGADAYIFIWSIPVSWRYRT
ncbi:MAG: hypothetical protein WC124_02080 [Desulfoplanes sp.]